MTKKLPKLTFECIKKVLKDYPNIDNHIKQRKEQRARINGEVAE